LEGSGPGGRDLVKPKKPFIPVSNWPKMIRG
jgi:hypothetical protein